MELQLFAPLHPPSTTPFTYHQGLTEKSRYIGPFPYSFTVLLLGTSFFSTHNKLAEPRKMRKPNKGRFQTVFEQ